MKSRQIGNWRVPVELKDCSCGSEVVLCFSNGRQIQGIFVGFESGRAVVQNGKRGARITYPMLGLYKWREVAVVKSIDAVVYPSDEPTISVVDDATYGGAHCYVIRECLGFNDGKTQYVETEQVIRFVRKNDDGTMIPGLQSEQLVLALLDRHEKLNARLPSEQNAKMIAGLRMFLEACEERVKNRMERGVMGELKK